MSHSGAVISTYYYLRDAQGNEMCRYVKYTNTTSQLIYVAQEHSIYGSSRVGVDGRKDTLYKAGNYSPSWGGVGISRRDLGSKSFELANHLGNVLVTVSDKPVYKVSSGTIHFNPEISSASDYYPFGAPITGRSFSSTEYRFGFNTQEKTDEIAGPGNHNTATFWEYDTRLDRRWNIDPVTKPWESLYAYLSDNPLLLNDPNGNDYVLTTKKNQDGKITHVKVSAKIYINGVGSSANRAKELTMSANETYKTKTVDGVEVRFDVQYVYSPNKTTGDLNSVLGENLLIFYKRAEPDNGPERSHINSFTHPSSPVIYTGNNGVINGSGKSNYTVMHESLHLIGLSDRYGANVVANIGYENDIMGAADKMTLNTSHYRNIIEYTQNKHNLLISNKPNLNNLYCNEVLDQKYEGGKAKLKR